MKKTELLKLIRMDEVKTEEVKWLWYPYIPFGKITVVQGDPGDGKTTAVLAIAAAVTTGSLLPETKVVVGPLDVIFQTAEDGLGDTVKPRLEQAGADCRRVIVIDETDKPLSLLDERIEVAIMQTGAKLLILDPLQAYLGADIDMHRANEIRPVLKRISAIAEKAECAVVVVGHLNKSTSKSQYRGLGSIDIQAAARSVITVARIKDKHYMRAIAQGKNNLAPEGKTIGFEIVPGIGFRWAGVLDMTIDELLASTMPERNSAYDKAIEFLRSELSNGERAASEVYTKAEAQSIHERTLKTAKFALGISSSKRGKKWYWKALPATESDVDIDHQ